MEKPCETFRHWARREDIKTMAIVDCKYFASFRTGEITSVLRFGAGIRLRLHESDTVPSTPVKKNNKAPDPGEIHSAMRCEILLPDCLYSRWSQADGHNMLRICQCLGHRLRQSSREPTADR